MVELVTNYLHDDLTVADRARFVDTSPRAPTVPPTFSAAYVQQIRRTIELAGKLNADSVDDVLGSAATGEPLSAFRASQSTP